MERREYQRKRVALLEQLNRRSITSEQCGERLKSLTKLYKESHEVDTVSIEKCPKCNQDIYLTKKGEYIDLRMRGVTYKEISKKFGISVSSLRTIRDRWNVDSDIDNW